MDGIDDERKDNLLRAFVIVGIEQLAVLPFEGETGSGYLPAAGNAVGIVCASTVHFCIEVQLRQQSPCSSL